MSSSLHSVMPLISSSRSGWFCRISSVSVKDRLADACREITLYAAEKGVRTCVENHGFFC